MITPYVKQMPYVVIVIQARMGSSRLPGKVLMDLNGEPMLGQIIKRVKRIRFKHAIVVASPDQEILDVAKRYKVWGFKGDEEDVLGRYLDASTWTGADIVVRITADCPLIDPQVADQVIAGLENYDFSSNVFVRSWPKGLDTEVMWRKTLKKIAERANQPRHVEHVTLYVYENPGEFNWNSVTQLPSDYSYMNWCVDTQEDLDRVRVIYKAMGKEMWTYPEILDYMGVHGG